MNLYQRHLPIPFNNYLYSTTERNPKTNALLTPLHWAARNGYFEICQYIMNNTFDTNPADNDGFTPFHNAASNGHSNICQLFIQVSDKHIH